MRAWMSAWLLAAAAGTGLAQGADVGLVNMVEGDVRYVPLAGAPGKVKPFMKLRAGDRLNLPAGSQLRIIYFESARQERWSGPASFRASSKAGEPISGKPADVTQLSAAVPQRIARVPDMLQNARLGGLQVRGGTAGGAAAGAQAQAAVREARAAYAQMRKELPADDITPELYLCSVLSDYALYDDMRPLAEDMLRRQPDNEDVRMLAAWIRRQAAGR